jgi:hypothetical protein
MFARHVTLQLQSGHLAEAGCIFGGSALPLLRQQPGFVDACMFGDDDGGIGIIVIFWRQAEDSQRLETNGFYRTQIAKFADVVIAPPQPALLAVVVSPAGTA